MANLNLNKVILGGRLTATPEIKTTPNGISVVSFTIAVNRRNSGTEAKADFINCVAWRQTAEFVAKYFYKGDSICVTGSIQTRSWTEQSGQKRYATEIVADEVYFVDSKSEKTRGQSETVPTASTGGMAQTDTAFETLTDEELPF